MPQRTTFFDELDGLATEHGGYLGQFLGAFSTAGRAQLRDQARTRVVQPRTILIAEGEEPDEIGFVLSGTLAITKLLPDGHGHILGLLVPTDTYGRPFGGPSHYHIEALSDARLLSVRRAMFERLLAEEPAVERLYVTHLLDELDLARESVLLLNGSKAIRRVASFLVMLARRKATDAERASPTVVLQVPLRRGDLASYLGVRPETLSRALHDLEDMKVLRLLGPYRFEIIDFPALMQVSGQELTATVSEIWQTSSASMA